MNPGDLPPVQCRAWYAEALGVVKAAMADYRARSGNPPGEEPVASSTSVTELIGWCFEQACAKDGPP